jgi:hypothetical protein
MHRTDTAFDPRIARTLRTWLTFGIAAVLLFPFARENTTWLGYLPMWLVAMPAAALWALHRFALPHWPVTVARGTQRARRRSAQATRRRDRGVRSQRNLRAA